MFGLFGSAQPQNEATRSYVSLNTAIVTLNFKENAIASVCEQLPFKPKVALGFVSPSLDFSAISSKLKQALPSETTLILSTTAGELCSINGSNPLPSLYSSARAGEGDNIVLMLYSMEMISDVYVASIPLKSEDMATSQKTASERIAAIAEEIKKVRVPFKMRSDDTLGYTLIDGLSASESFFMEAVYTVAKFPCLLIGGSAGGKLDFQNTYIYDGTRTLRHHAVVTFIKLAPNYRFGVFKSQNFKKTSTVLTVLAANPIARTVSAFLDRKTNVGINAVKALMEHFHCSANELNSKLSNYTFGIEIDGEIYIRSIASVDVSNETLHFYCDIEAGEELVLLGRNRFCANDTSRFCRI